MMLQSSKPPVSSKRRAWDPYEKDISGFKLSKEQILRKKKLLISKNNILVETDEKERAVVAAKALRKEKDAIAAARRTSRKQRSSKTIFNCYEDHDDSQRPDISKTVEGSTVLDLLDDSVEDAEDESNENTFDLADNQTKRREGNRGVTSVQVRAKSSMRIASSKNKPTKVSTSPVSTTPSEDLTDVVDVLRALTAEMKYYETVTGRQASFDTEELNAMLDEEPESSNFSIKQVMLFMTQLVSQTMTHLLRSEIEVKLYRDKYEELSQKVEQLSLGTNAISPISAKKSALQRDVGISRMQHGDFSSFYVEETRDPSNETDDLMTKLSTESIFYDDEGEQDIGYELEDSSVLLQQNLMNGSSASDWLFASQAKYRSPVKSYDARGGSF
jgi:hypothetical protein